MSSKLYRSRNVIISGVCGGLAEHFRIDPTIIRVVWALIAISEPFLAIIGYLVCAIIIPQKPIEGYGYKTKIDEMTDNNEHNQQTNSNSNNSSNNRNFSSTTAGLALILIGSVFIFKQFFFWFNFNNLWPAILIIIGIYIIIKKR